MIRLLSKDTIDKIAAGEVIDRPESVARELLDNAIDSGADRISLEIRKGGTELIRVTDNGCGIDASDLETAFLRHATSKLRDASDLEHIRSLGFRGEALASICAVSKTEIITKTKGSLTGSRYEINGGTSGEITEVGAPDGTTVIVRDLFYNVPARRAFLRSAATEAAYITDTAEKAALSHPEIAITLISDGRVLINTLGGGRLSEAIYMIYGKEVTEQLIKVDRSFPDAGISISGYIGKPVIARARRDLEICFVNRRYIRSEIIRRAIEDGYEGYMMQHRFPFTVLSLDMVPEKLDVNVHPKKMEVRFSDDASVYDAVFRTVREGLREKELIVEAKAPAEKDPMPSESHGQPEAIFSETEDNGDEAEESRSEDRLPGHVEPFEETAFKEYKEALNKKLNYEVREERPLFGGKDPSPEDTVSPEGQQKLPPSFFLSDKAVPYFRMIGQIFGTYWIIEYEDSMYLIDQHAAHEKVNYERLLSRLREKDISSQYIYPPIMLNLGVNEACLVGEHLEDFTALGFELEHAGDRDYIVRAVPSDLPELSRKDLLMEMIDSLSEENGRASSESLKDKLASMSCKAAVKGNSHLSEPEMKKLIEELLTLDNPYNCPHGRPTIVRWSRYELDKMFRRIV